MGLWPSMINLSLPPDLRIEEIFNDQNIRTELKNPAALEGESDGHWHLLNPAPHGSRFRLKIQLDSLSALKKYSLNNWLRVGCSIMQGCVWLLETLFSVIRNYLNTDISIPSHLFKNRTHVPLLTPKDGNRYSQFITPDCRDCVSAVDHKARLNHQVLNRNDSSSRTSPRSQFLHSLRVSCIQVASNCIWTDIKDCFNAEGFPENFPACQWYSRAEGNLGK